MDKWTITVTLTVTITVNITVTITVTATVTVTVTLILTLNKEKGKYFDSDLCLNRSLNWTLACEASVGVSVKNVTVLSQTIFSCAGDIIAQKMSSYVEY